MSENYIPIEDDFNVQSGFAFPSSSFVDDGIPIVRMSDLKNGRLKFENTKYVGISWLKTSALFLLKENDFLVGMSGSLSNYAVVSSGDMPALLNQRVGRLQSKSGKQSYEYVCYWLKSDFYHRYAEIQGEGAAQKNISSKQIGLFKYRAVSLDEQCRIVGILQTIDRTIEKTESLIDKCQQIKAGLMHDLFTRGIGADGKLRPPREQAPELYQETSIGWIPRGWETTSLSSLSTLITKGATPTTYGYDYVTEFDEGCVRFLRATNATPEGRYRDPEPRFISGAANQLLFRSQLEPGDTVMSIVGARVGTSFSVDPSVLPANINQNVALIRPDRTRVFPAYIGLCITSDFVQNEILNLATTQAQPSLSLKQVGDIFVPSPTLVEQEKILDKSKSLITRLDSLITEKSKLIAIKSALMHDLLTGKVPVNADQPEPAHV